METTLPAFLIHVCEIFKLVQLDFSSMFYIVKVYLKMYALKLKQFLFWPLLCSNSFHIAISKNREKNDELRVSLVCVFASELKNL